MFFHASIQLVVAILVLAGGSAWSQELVQIDAKHEAPR